ncbi:B12-binding domain-containing radical SAM protein [uncultured Selenomonas sp.]|uniref:B12-binding domain-containing radical SAM protein n=1 Tax=uncultured Selenomonas sp. TaxID=159275 RepID=UPI0025FB2449|nr:B12-binding domain-containing radical SAM protein [uncultured Selenomonas sp.]
MEALEKKGARSFVKAEEIVWLAINAKYSHTSLAVRYLRQAVPGSRILELTINDYLLPMLGQIYEMHPRVLGIACYIWNIELVKQLLPLLPSALPDCTIICGGPEVSYETSSFLRQFPMVDYVVRGEGEEATAELCKRLLAGQSGADILGIAWRDDDNIHEGAAVVVDDFSVVPFPYTEEELSGIREQILYYETSRGCPFSCAYCLSCATAGVRFLPMERVLKELAFFVRHDVRQVKFVDRTFNAKKSHFLPILRFIAALTATCRTNFHFEVAIDYLDGEVLDVLSQMPKGRVQLEIGIQSTNAATLAAVSRVNHWTEIATHIRTILGFHNIHLHVDLIIGLPGEGMASFHKSFNDVFALQPDALQLGFLKFLKGAAMMQLVEPYHYQYMPLAPYEVLSSDALTYGEIRWLHTFEDVFEQYYNADRCRTATAWLTRKFTGDDAFAFWQELADWWESKDNHHRSHAPKRLYAYLLDFAREWFCADKETLVRLDALLRYDAIRKEGLRAFPPGLAWQRERRGRDLVELFPCDVLALAAGKPSPLCESTIFLTTDDTSHVYMSTRD